MFDAVFLPPRRERSAEFKEKTLTWKRVVRPEASLSGRVDSCTDNGTESHLDLPLCKLFLLHSMRPIQRERCFSVG